MCASQRISLFASAWNPHKGPYSETSCETRSRGGKEGSRESSRQRRAEEDGWLEIAVQGKDGQQKKAVREDSQRWVSFPCGFCRSFAQNTCLRYKCTENAKCHKLPFLCLELTQVHVCSFVLFLPPSQLYLCGRKEMCKSPSQKRD